jgi:hypothetical protein
MMLDIHEFMNDNNEVCSKFITPYMRKVHDIFCQRDFKKFDGPIMPIKKLGVSIHKTRQYNTRLWVRGRPERLFGKIDATLTVCPTDVTPADLGYARHNDFLLWHCVPASIQKAYLDRATKGTLDIDIDIAFLESVKANYFSRLEGIKEWRKISSGS